MYVENNGNFLRGVSPETRDILGGCLIQTFLCRSPLFLEELRPEGLLTEGWVLIPSSSYISHVSTGELCFPISGRGAPEAVVSPITRPVPIAGQTNNLWHISAEGLQFIHGSRRFGLWQAIVSIRYATMSVGSKEKWG